jgi:hypothetical protein
MIQTTPSNFVEAPKAFVESEIYTAMPIQRGRTFVTIATPIHHMAARHMDVPIAKAIRRFVSVI